MFPLFLNLKDRLCLVVGGGPVGRRKAGTLLRAGARVRLVCLEARTELEAGAQPEWRQEPYRSDHLEGVALAFGAATRAVNARLAADARARGIWVNLADDPQAGDFFVPASIRRDGLVLAVSTCGSAPGLARRIRQRLEEEFDSTVGEWVALLAELRPLVLAINDRERRRKLFDRLADWSWLERIRKEGVEATRQAMRRELDG